MGYNLIMSTQNNVAILVDAKHEYTKQLINILKKSIYLNIKDIYDTSETECKKDNEINNTLFKFQSLLEKIPKWENDLLEKCYKDISENSKCDWIDDLLTAVFITHTKILTLVHKNNFNNKINLKIPKPEHFIHLCFIECAREFWKNPFLFSKDVSQYEYQKNVKESESVISECINETIRKQLPVKHILKEYLGDFYNSEPEDDIDITEEYSKKHLNNIKKMIKKELEKDVNSDNEENIETIIKDEIKKQIKEKKNKKEETEENKKENDE